MYNQLWTKILDSSIWLEDQPTRIVWITFLACMDKDGVVALSSIGNVANRARVSVEEAESAIECLAAPDVYNPDQEHEGRRIERIPGVGWLVINKDKYDGFMKAASIRAATRERTKKWREQKKAETESGDAPVTQGDESVTPSESESESDHIQTQNQIQTLKRWIDSACAKKSDLDLRLVEIAVIETWLKKGDNSGPVRSVKYFFPEIERVCAAAVGLSSEAIDALLRRRREQVGLITAI